MFKIFTKSQPIIPIIYVDAHLNQLNAANLLKKLRKTKYNTAQGIAVVCSITNNMPVQVDKIYQQINRIKQQYKIPLYSFLSDECNPQSYYMASCADHIYSLPNTIFNLHHDRSKVLWDGFLSQYKLKKYVIRSGDKLSGSAIDQYTSPNTQTIINRKDSNIDSKLYTESITNRLYRISKQQGNKQYEQQINTNISQNIPQILIGQQAIKLGLVDNIGQHYQILKNKFPECRFEVIKYINEPKMKWSLLIALLIIKGTIKWSLIIYLWLKAKQNNKNKLINGISDIVK